MKPNTDLLAYYEIDTPLITAHEWPDALIALTLERGLEEHQLLRATGIFREDIATRKRLLTPQQCLQLIQNTHKCSHKHELAFLLGHDYFSAQQNPAITALNTASNPQNAIDILIDHQARLLPLLNLRCRYEQEHLVLYWHYACGAQSAAIFLVEMMCTALSSFTRWRSGAYLPWQFYFTHSKPHYIEQYEVHLNNSVHFSCQANAMAIAREYLHLPWQPPYTTPNSSPAALINTPSGTTLPQQGFLTAIYQYLHLNIQHNPNLEKTAQAFGMSSASLKRKLKKHHSHFQEQYDLVRKDLALYWLQQAGWSKEQVARELHFYDVANLRRAFKKWTGHLPSNH